ncbi:hypothetical protein BJX70DRAFT_251605 [Aspergillus crustosus]
MFTPRPSPTPRSGLTVPATQSTAPVIKYRCLFTHDMRRKAKRWHDGFLRYHTFNKRVMVYDNTGYFIGDLHWRAPDGIQDGDELELDKGVLIQVCEPLEQTETDISSLHKNRSQDSPVRTETTPSVRSTAPRAPLSQTSRSLKDLLGINKPPTSQILSPYEQRRKQNQIYSQRLHERPAKRQRAASPEPRQENVVDLLDSPPRQAPRTEIRPAPSRSEPTRNASVPKPPIQPTSSTNAASKPPVPPVTSIPSGPSEPSATTVPSVTSIPTKPSSAQTVSQIQRVPSGAEPSSTLRLSSNKPRRKLMYQESTHTKPQSRSQLSRTHSQCQPTTNHDASSSPVIIIDDDDSPEPAPIIAQPARIALNPNSLQSEFSGHNSKSNQDPGTPNSNPPERDRSPPKPTPSATRNLYSVPAHTRTPDPPDPKPQGSTARVRTTGLRKSFSDPIPIISLHSRPISAPSPLDPIAESNGEQGPWTSEALDLFDFWPPGRPKPV